MTKQIEPLRNLRYSGVFRVEFYLFCRKKICFRSLFFEVIIIKLKHYIFICLVNKHIKQICCVFFILMKINFSN